MTSDKDDINFRQAMHDVRRLNANERAKTRKPVSPKHANKRYTRARINTALRETEAHIKRGVRAVHAAPPGTKENEAGAAQLLFARPGLQRKVIRQLARMQHFPDEGILDLHGCNQATATSALNQFLPRCQLAGYPYILIIHGKGLHAEHGEKLKTLTANWLKQQPAVLAYTSAHQHAGGSGALAILLRRS